MFTRPAVLVTLAALAIGAGTPARAQNLNAENPVFVNDSPGAADTILQIEDGIARGNVDQALRQLQKLMDEQPLALVPRRDDPSCYRSVRSVLLGILKEDQVVLAKYRRAQSGPAEDHLAAGKVEDVERSALLTSAGMKAALQLAGRHLEAARFDAALAILEQLDAHPDRREATLGASAVRTALLLARYLPRAAPLAQRWQSELGAPAEVLGAIAGPPVQPVLSPLGPCEAGDLAGIVAQPLATWAFTPPDPSDSPRSADGDQSSPFTRELRALPSLMGDAVFVASAKAIGAYDRYTLVQRWSQSLPELLGPDEAPDRNAPFRGGRRSGFNPAEDIRTVTVGRSIALVAAASDSSNLADVREAIAAFDPSSGKLRWATPLKAFDADLEHAHARGALLLDPSGSMAFVVTRKDAPDKRLRALYLSGMDTADGSPLWSTLVGSVGILPFQQFGSLGDSATLFDGVIYASDRIGIACAYEAATGRPIWVRRLTGETLDNQVRMLPFQVSAPIVDGERLIVHSPDRRSLLVLDRATGRQLSERQLTPGPRDTVYAYVLPVGEMLVLVGDSSLAVLPRSALTSKPKVVEFTPALIRGRVVASGDRLLVPLDRELAIVSTLGNPTKSQQLLDESGNLIFADDQLLVADDSRLHSYLSWESADRVLTQRIGLLTSDPSPGIALAELAYRSSHDDRILKGVDAARAALTAGGADDHRIRLIASIRAMIDAAQNGASAVGRGPVSRELLGQLIERLGSVSKSPAERAAHLLVLGRQQEDLSQGPSAAESYQAILDDNEMRGVMWQGARLGVRADTEATRRLEQLLTRDGRGVYQKFETLAEGAAALMPADAAPEDLEKIARRFPVALAAPRLWDRIAAAYERDKRSRAAARALEIGLQTSERIPGVPLGIVGELAGRLVSNLIERGLSYAADDSLRRTRATFPGVVLTLNGAPINDTEIISRIAADRAQFNRWPTLGSPTAQNAQVLPGWILMDPVVRDPQPQTTSCLALRHIDGRIALFARSGGADEGFRELWSAKSELHQAELLRIDRSAAVFYTWTKEGGSLSRVDASTGRLLWSTDPFSTHFPAGVTAQPNPLRGPRGLGNPAGLVDKQQTPLEGVRPMNEVIFSSDERTLSMVERTGRAVAFDSDSGQRLWAASLPFAVVFDATTSRNLLAVAGDTDAPAAPVTAGPGGASGRGRAAQIVLLDARTGDLVHTIRIDQGQVRWMRFGTRGELIAGLTGSVIAVDVETGTITWSNSQPPCTGTLAAWVIGEQVIIQAENRQTWLLSARTGLYRNAPIDTRDRLESSATPRALYTQSGNVALSTPQGLVLFAPDGTILGLDALGGNSLLPPLATRDGFILMESESSSRDRAGPAAYSMHFLDSRSALLGSTTPVALVDPPTRMAATDGFLALSAGSGTIVFSAPADK